MPLVFAATVGGSCQPIVTAILDFQPDYVVFFVTTGPKGSRMMIDGSGEVCKERSNDPRQGGETRNLPNILVQTRLERSQYAIVEVSEPDALDRCYSLMRSELLSAAKNRADWRRIADYTGGTKTMGAALVLAALDADWQLSLVKGTRNDLVKVVDGSELASLANVWEVRVQQRMAEAFELFNQYAYFAAGKLLEVFGRGGSLSPDTDRQIRKWVSICRGFDAWDRIARLAEWFEHTSECERIAAFYRKLEAVNPGPNAALIQLGWGTGWDGKTFWTHLQADARLFSQLLLDFRMLKGRGAPRPGAPFPTSRRVVMLVKESIARPAAPFGWALIKLVKETR